MYFCFWILTILVIGRALAQGAANGTTLQNVEDFIGKLITSDSSMNIESRCMTLYNLCTEIFNVWFDPTNKTSAQSSHVNIHHYCMNPMHCKQLLNISKDPQMVKSAVYKPFKEMLEQMMAEQEKELINVVAVFEDEWKNQNEQLESLSDHKPHFKQQEPEPVLTTSEQIVTSVHHEAKVEESSMDAELITTTKMLESSPRESIPTSGALNQSEIGCNEPMIKLKPSHRYWKRIELGFYNEKMLEKQVNDLMEKLLFSSERNMNTTSKCCQVYGICRAIGDFVGKKKGRESEYCVGPDRCEWMWERGDATGLNQEIIGGYAIMLVGLDTEAMRNIRNFITYEDYD